MKSAVVITETFQDYERLIFDTVNRFVRRHGGDFDEYVAEANLVFMRCFYQHDNNGAMFSTYLVSAIQKRLISLGIAETTRRQHYMPMSQLTAEDNAPFDAPAKASRHALESLTGDAATIVQLIIDTPAEIRLAVIECKQSGKAWRRAIRSYLRHVGWDGWRIDASMEAVENALV